VSGCAAAAEPLILEKVVATHGVAATGPSTGTATFDLVMAGRLLHVTVMAFARGSGGKAIPAAYTYVGETWTLTAQSDSKAEPLNDMFTGRQLPDSWELETGIRRGHGAIVLAAQAAPLVAEVIVRVIFEPADAAMSAEQLQRLYAQCHLTVNGDDQPLALAEGT